MHAGELERIGKMGYGKRFELLAELHSPNYPNLWFSFLMENPIAIVRIPPTTVMHVSIPLTCRVQ